MTTENWWESAPLADAPKAGAVAGADDWWKSAPLADAAPKPGTAQSFGAGVLRGAKDVIDTGAQLLATGFDKIAGTQEGQRVGAMNAAGKKEFDATYGKDNTAASVGRVGGQIAATLPVGGALGAGVKAAGVAGALPKAAVPLGEAIASGGLSAQGANMATRAAGGAIAGGATAGLVDPDQAVTGAAIGAAFPVAIRGAAQGMQRVGQAIRGPEVAPATRQAAAAGQKEGYVVPPTQVEPTLGNRLMEGMAGKLTTAQNASARNQPITNRLAMKAIGADELTPEALAAVRARANAAYDALGQAGTFTADLPFRAQLAKLGSGSKQMQADFPELMRSDVDGLLQSFAGKEGFNAQSGIEAIKRLRADARANKLARDNPDRQALGSVQNKISGALEDLIDRNLKRSGNDQLLNDYRNARQTLAKVYDVEAALNPMTGTVDAAKLAQILKKGRPLSGELKQAAEFASAFPKAVQTPERMGSLPQTSPLDWTAALGIGAATGGSPLAAAGLVARPLARAATLSGPVQRSIVRAPAGRGGQPALSAADRLGSLEYLNPAASVALSARDR